MFFPVHHGLKGVQNIKLKNRMKTVFGDFQLLGKLMAQFIKSYCRPSYRMQPKKI